MNDLNQLMPLSSSHGDFGVNEPVNGWTGAATDVVIYMSYVGDSIVQFGHDAGTPDDLWVRRRSVDSPQWSEWGNLGEAVAPAPAPAPIISNLLPAGGTAGDDDTVVRVLGGSFVDGATVTGQTTTFVSASELNITLPAASITEPGLDFTVTNPDSQVSNTVNWPVAATPPEARNRSR